MISSLANISLIIYSFDRIRKSRTDELFPTQQREDLMSEKIADDAIMEAGDIVESAIRGLTNQVP